MNLVSRSAAPHRDPAHAEVCPSEQAERAIGPARGIFYAVLFGGGIWLIVLAVVEGVRHLLRF